MSVQAETAPSFRYLFRYRDLTADTLDEHRQILDSRRACWWGWWKRPTESGRLEVWDALEAACNDGTPVVIGLFDSGRAQVHLARVDRVIKPRPEALGTFAPVMPPGDEHDLIPEYYRTSRHSRGWLHFIDLSTDATPFFGLYSYRVPPPLPGLGPRQLSTLRGKLITDGDELRAMDTTIWEVRPKKPQDTTGRFLAATIDYDAPLLARAVECPGEWILHLTDVHYAVGSHRSQHRWRLESETTSGARQTMADAVGESLTRSDRRVGAIVVTGDLTFQGSADEFDAARAGLRKLTDGHLGLGMEHLVVIPGNHDIGWTRTDPYSDTAVVDVAPPEATKNYRQFFTRLFGYEPTDHLSIARRFLFPGGTLVDVVGVNSSSLEQGKDFLAGMGRVQEAGYREAAKVLGWERPTMALRVLALHHHLALTENLEAHTEYRTGFGIAIDAPRIQRMAAKDGVHLALHGHKHRAFVWRAGAYELPEFAAERWDLGSINIVGGGSAGSTSTDGGRNFYNLVRYMGRRIELEIYRSQDAGSFERIRCWTAELDATDSGMEVGPWRLT